MSKNDFLDALMGRNDYLSACGAVYSGDVQYFRELKPQWQTEEVARVWLSHHEDSLHEIPLRLVGDDLRRHAVQTCPINLRHIRSTDTAIYTELFRLAIRGHGLEMGHVEVNAIGPRDMATWLAMRPTLEDDFWRVKRWPTQEDRMHYHNEMYAVIPNFITSEDIPHVPDEIILEGAENYGITVRVLTLLDACGRHQLLDRLSELDNWEIIKKPRDLDEAAALLVSGVRPGALLLLKSFIRKFPMESVCNIFSGTPERQQALALLYSAEELLPFCENLSHTKRQLLEQCLSL